MARSGELTWTVVDQPSLLKIGRSRSYQLSARSSKFDGHPREASRGLLCQIRAEPAATSVTVQVVACLGAV